MKVTLRALSILGKGNTKERLSSRKPLSLDQFLQRQGALELWKDILRSTRKIRMLDIRKEMRLFAKEEFQRNRDVEDITHVRYLISTGREQFKNMERYVEELGRRQG